MIGLAILATGLLLVLSGVIAARIPGGASFARPGTVVGGDPGAGLFAFARRGSNPVQAFVLAPVHPATWYANGAILGGLFVGVLGGGIVLSLISAGLSTLLAGIGLLFIAFAIEGSRLLARIERRRAFAGEAARPPAHPYRPLGGGGVLGALRGEFADESRWRDVLYVAVNLPLAVLELLVVTLAWLAAMTLLTSPIWYDLASSGGAVSVFGPLAGHDPATVMLRGFAGLALLPVAASLSQVVIALHRGVVAGLLCTSESRALRRQVEALRRSRSAVLDVEASELHRIERDLHDGAQQRLVALTIDLGLAAERIDDDPDAARQLIRAGQQQARQALGEIRDLVRGIAPSILLDRGLSAALESVAGQSPVPTVLVTSLAPGERLPVAVERAAYFVATEALANIAKHATAARAEVRARRDADQLVVEVWDDGHGGARAEPGGGLAGLEHRIAGVDGSFVVSSPAGGPTLVRAEIPIPAPVPEAAGQAPGQAS